ncbi:hypothetical protein CBL_08386 [Carabus blaptoides fortunei]
MGKLHKFKSPPSTSLSLVIDSEIPCQKIETTLASSTRTTVTGIYFFQVVNTIGRHLHSARRITVSEGKLSRVTNEKWVNHRQPCQIVWTGTKSQIPRIIQQIVGCSIAIKHILPGGNTKKRQEFERVSVAAICVFLPGLTVIRWTSFHMPMAPAWD